MIWLTEKSLFPEILILYTYIIYYVRYTFIIILIRTKQGINKIKTGLLILPVIKTAT
jgi:hypothetical protein